MKMLYFFVAVVVIQPNPKQRMRENITNSKHHPDRHLLKQNSDENKKNKEKQSDGKKATNANK